MRYHFFIPVTILITFFHFTVVAQYNDQYGKMSDEEWLATITSAAKQNASAQDCYMRNKIAAQNSEKQMGGARSRYGFALYFIQAGNVQVPYLVYIPFGYSPAYATSLVVFLHGAILAKDSFQYKDPAIANEPIFSVADSLKSIIIFPFARTDFKWSGQSPAYENIITIIHQVERDYNVDKKKIYIGGISMGGIATFWFVNNHPDLFAGFYTFSAAPRSPDGAIKYSNITKGKPLYTVNAKDDPVFSYTEMETAYKDHKTEAPGWHYATVDAGGHRFIYGQGGAEQVKSLLSKLLSAQQ